MAIKFQYNKTSLQSLDKQLKMRVRALPTIKNKESALRSEVKKAKEVADEFDGKLDDTLNGTLRRIYSGYSYRERCQYVGEENCRSTYAGLGPGGV